MFRKIISIFFIFTFLALAGCMGMKTDINDCNSLALEEKVGCYRQVALTLAAKGDMDNAKQSCGRIDANLDPDADSSYFITQKDLCYYDIAKLTGDDSICRMISNDASGSVLTGAEASEQMCLKKVENEKILRNQHKLCGLAVFIFPLIVGYSFYLNRKIK